MSAPGTEVNNPKAIQPIRATVNVQPQPVPTHKKQHTRTTSESKLNADINVAAAKHHKFINNPTTVPEDAKNKLVYREKTGGTAEINHTLTLTSNQAMATSFSNLENRMGSYGLNKTPFSDDNFLRWKQSFQKEILKLSEHIEGDVDGDEYERDAKFFVASTNNPRGAGIGQPDYTDADIISPITSTQFDKFIRAKMEAWEDEDSVKILETVDEDFPEEVAENSLYEDEDLAYGAKSGDHAKTLTGKGPADPTFSFFAGGKTTQQLAEEVEAEAKKNYSGNNPAGWFTEDMAKLTLKDADRFKGLTEFQKDQIFRHLASTTPPNYVDTVFEDVKKSELETAGLECIPEGSPAPSGATLEKKANACGGDLNSKAVGIKAIEASNLSDTDIENKTTESNGVIDGQVAGTDTEALQLQEDSKDLEGQVDTKDSELVDAETSAADDAPNGSGGEKEEEVSGRGLFLAEDYQLDLDTLIGAHDDAAAKDLYLELEHSAFANAEWVTGGGPESSDVESWESLKDKVSEAQETYGKPNPNLMFGERTQKFKRKEHTIVIDTLLYYREQKVFTDDDGNIVSEGASTKVVHSPISEGTVVTPDISEEDDGPGSIIKGDGYQVKITANEEGNHKVDVTPSNVGVVVSEINVIGSGANTRTRSNYKVPLGTSVQEVANIITSVYTTCSVISGGDKEDPSFAGAVDG